MNAESFEIIQSIIENVEKLIENLGTKLLMNTEGKNYTPLDSNAF